MTVRELISALEAVDQERTVDFRIDGLCFWCDRQTELAVGVIEVVEDEYDVILFGEEEEE